MIQHKGWGYHTLPMRYGFYLALTAVALGYAARLAMLPRWAGPGVAALVLLAFGWSYLRTARSAWHYEAYPEVTRLIAAETQPRDEVLVVSTSVACAYPALVELQRCPGSRYLWHFPIAFFQAAPAALAKEEQRYLSELRADILTRQPRLILLDASPESQGCGPDFRLPDYLRRQGILDLITARYERLASAPTLLAFRRTAF